MRPCADRVPVPFESELGADVPGGVYLCQVSDRISCGACCGLYNVAGVSREMLYRLLARRTTMFAGVPRRIEAILEFKNAVESGEPQIRPFPEFHHCPFIGLIGARRSRVGCLLHPMADGNAGIDWRGISYYGGMACRTYFCPSAHRLPADIRKLVQEAANDWYDYGLVITDTEFLTAVFDCVAGGSGHPIQPDMLLQRPDGREAVRDVFRLKIDWPFRPELRNTPAHYFFKDRRYPRPEVDYAAVGTAPSIYDPVLRALGTAVSTIDDLVRAETAVARVVDKLRSC